VGVEVDLTPLAPSALALALAVALDLAIGDPVYPLHPVRLIGRTLTFFEDRLRGLGFDGYGGGIALFVLLSALWVVVWSGAVLAAGFLVHVFVLYSCIALRDLLGHAFAVEKAAERNDLPGARQAISQLVGRDTDRMDFAACRRAAIESLAENLTDGWISPLFWYVVAGVPGVVLFKVVSTMDSMVGYRTAKYLRFGWCGARLDDWMNFVPARLTWLLVALVAALLPGYSGRKALRIGWTQHSIVPGPNSGWSEAAVAGAIERRLAGPIWAKGRMVTDVWLGDPSDFEAGGSEDLRGAGRLVLAVGLASAVLFLQAIYFK
jgi:adenosylcobinamide-phosphate synthase